MSQVQRSIPKGITVKSDQTQEERQRDSLLLAERWKLMQSGVDKKEIKIKLSTIYVKGMKHGQIVNKCFQYYPSSNPPVHSETDQSTDTQINDA